MSIGTKYVNDDSRRLLRDVIYELDHVLIASISAIGVPYAGWLVTQSGVVLKIASEMVEIEDRFEVGRLVVEFDVEPPSHADRFAIPPDWRNVSAIESLHVVERPPWSQAGDGGVDVEAGIRFRLSDGRAWSVVVGAQPCTLAIDAPFAPVVAYPQYKKGDYKAVPL